MSTSYGAYAGTVLKIDLTTRAVTDYPVNDEDRILFLGGKILAARIMNDFIKGPMDPYGEENVIVVSSCPLNATGCPSSSRFNVSTVSPLTGLLTSSNCGGSFGCTLKRAGYDALVITGKSKGKIGKVTQVLTGENKVIVEGVNVQKKHQKPNPNLGIQGGIVDKEAPIHVSNVAIYNPETKKADRVGFRFEDGKKVRFFKSNGQAVPSQAK